MQNNVIDRTGITGVALGALGVLGFSVTLPATRIAVADLDPWLVSFGRAAVAGVLALAYLYGTNAPRPTHAQLRRLGLVVLGIVVGFPTFTSLALVSTTSSHGAVVIACLPMATAVFAVLRDGERPPAMFWLASVTGMVAVLGFIAASGGLSGGVSLADVFLLVAVVLAGLGYVEGGALARELGGGTTIALALVLSLPVTAPVTLALLTTSSLGDVGTSAWLAFGYVSLVSMFLGFFAWYAGLARGGVARVGQVQLAQPVLTLGWSVLLLGERVGLLTVLTALAVVACVVWTQRARSYAAPSTGVSMDRE